MIYLDRIKYFFIGGIYVAVFYGIGLATTQLF
jgi:hypothetical protein